MNPGHLILPLYLFTVVAWAGILALNARWVRRRGGGHVQGFEDLLGPEVVKKSAEYAEAKTRIALATLAVWNVALTAFLVGGGLTAFQSAFAAIEFDFLERRVVFFFLLVFAMRAFHLPFALIDAYRVEARFGFNKAGPLPWLRSWVKRSALSSLFWAVACMSVANFLEDLPETLDPYALKCCFRENIYQAAAQVM